MSPRERRLVAVGLLVAVVALVQLAVIQPILDGFTARAAEREVLMLRQQQYARRIATIPRLARAAERQRGAEALYQIDAATIGAGTAALLERMGQAVTATGGELRAGEEGTAPAGWVRARVAARLTQGQLADALARLQNQPPYLLVDRLRVAADDAEVTGRAGPMEVSVEATIPVRVAPARR